MSCGSRDVYSAWKTFVELLDALEQDSQIEIVSLTEELYQQAFQLFRNRPDKEWGLVDCVSLVVMRRFFC